MLQQVAPGSRGAAFALVTVRRLLERFVIPGKEAIAAMNARLELPETQYREP